jgi:peptidoglycan/xylan/chitin deacetylase (PgdA/CDA1 family)
MSHNIFMMAALLLTSSCGVYKWWGGKSEVTSRQMASLNQSQLLLESPDIFEIEIQNKLEALHSYYTIGQINLHKFDEMLKESDPEAIYNSAEYLKLMAVRIHAEEIEHDLVDLWTSLAQQKGIRAGKQKLMILSKIMQFRTSSKTTSFSMENLISKLELPTSASSNGQKLKTSGLSLKEIREEYSKLDSTKDFQIAETNIEHLSHMLRTEKNQMNQRFYPSSSRAGNITGNEFPAKVWSLTFDDGPKKDTSITILNNLKKRNLPATFFQLTEKVATLKTTAHEIRDAGMEIASHSYSHQQLTKVGAQALEKEITQAVSDLKSLHDIQKIEFFRLPYGAGVNTPHIREKIAQNNLIHVFWNIDTLDWMAQEPQKIIDRTLSLMQKTKNDAGVLLFHDIHQRTADATPKIMDYLKKDGRRVCTLGKIVQQMNEGAEVCPQK